MINLVIFDMDGTVLDTEVLRFDCFNEVFRNMGLTFSRDLYASLLGKRQGESKQMLEQIFGVDLINDESLYHKLEELEVQKMKNGIKVKPGYEKLRAYLKTSGIDMALATSTYRKKAEECLALAEITDDFSLIICGDEVIHGKPDPEIFLTVAEKKGITSDQIMVLEDSFSGVQAAHDAGMVTVMVPDMREPTKEISQLLYKKAGDLNEVICIIEEFNTKGSNL